jgi:TRAP-type C4-dicarboxylate transport system permease small subunit
MLVLAITVVVFLQVVMRYVFLHSFTWVEEMSKFFLIWISCLGAAYALREGMHISILYFQEKVPKNLQPVVFLINSLLVLIFFGICFVQGILHSFGEWHQLSPGMGVPLTFGHLSIPVGFGIMTLVLVELFIEEAKKLLTEKRTKRIP